MKLTIESAFLLFIYNIHWKDKTSAGSAHMCLAGYINKSLAGKFRKLRASQRIEEKYKNVPLVTYISSRVIEE